MAAHIHDEHQWYALRCSWPIQSLEEHWRWIQNDPYPAPNQPHLHVVSQNQTLSLLSPNSMTSQMMPRKTWVASKRLNCSRSEVLIVKANAFSTREPIAFVSWNSARVGVELIDPVQSKTASPYNYAARLAGLPPGNTLLSPKWPSNLMNSCDLCDVMNMARKRNNPQTTWSSEEPSLTIFMISLAHEVLNWLAPIWLQHDALVSFPQVQNSQFECVLRWPLDILCSKKQKGFEAKVEA